MTNSINITQAFPCQIMYSAIEHNFILIRLWKRIYKFYNRPQNINILEIRDTGKKNLIERGTHHET